MKDEIIHFLEKNLIGKILFTDKVTYTLGRKKPLLDGFCVTIAVLPISQMCYHYE